MAISDFVNFGQLGGKLDPLDEAVDPNAFVRALNPPSQSRESNKILQGVLRMLGEPAPSVEPGGLTPEDVVAATQMAAQGKASRAGTLAQVSGIAELMEKIPQMRAQTAYLGRMPRAVAGPKGDTELDWAKHFAAKRLTDARAGLLGKQAGAYLPVLIKDASGNVHKTSMTASELTSAQQKSTEIGLEAGRLTVDQETLRKQKAKDAEDVRKYGITTEAAVADKDRSTAEKRVWAKNHNSTSEEPYVYAEGEGGWWGLGEGKMQRVTILDAEGNPLSARDLYATAMSKGYPTVDGYIDYLESAGYVVTREDL